MCVCVCVCVCERHDLNSYSLAVTLLTTRFNIQKFYMVITLCICVVYGS